MTSLWQYTCMYHYNKNSDNQNIAAVILQVELHVMCLKRCKQNSEQRILWLDWSGVHTVSQDLSVPIFSARPRSAKYTIGICFKTAKNTKAFECFFIGFQHSLWKFSTTGNLYSPKSWLWLPVIACVVRWPISNALLNDIWLACFTRMHNCSNYWHKHHGFMVNSILGPFNHSQLAPFHWSIRSLVSSHLYCTQVSSILSIFCTFFVY